MSGIQIKEKSKRNIKCAVVALAVCLIGGIIVGGIMQQGKNKKRAEFESSLFGENTYIISPNDDSTKVEHFLKAVWKKQQANQFGEERYAIYFMPGSYAKKIKVNVGFYTQVAGLGKESSDTQISNLTCNARWLTEDKKNHNALCNFWRGVENLEIKNNTMWAVSQATELRNVTIDGSLYLHDEGGWSSGGFVADSKINGIVDSGSQQQFLFLNSSFKEWMGQNWNLVFAGLSKECAPVGTWPLFSYTTIKEAPIRVEKPYLVWDEQKGYQVCVPKVQKRVIGIPKASKEKQNKYIKISRFYIAKANKDTAKTINEALHKGKNLILTPGVYHLNQPIVVTKKDTIILGMGYATLTCDNDTACLITKNVSGVSISGILFDAGKVASKHLLVLGQKTEMTKVNGTEENNIKANDTEENDIKENDEKEKVTGENNTEVINTKENNIKEKKEQVTALHDLFFRVGGTTDAYDAQTQTCMEINQDQVVGDNFWIWRADHGAGVGWDKNKSDTGVIVRGDDVTLYALMVEHFQKYQTIWQGKNGFVCMYQSEIPYDVPNQAQWMSENGNKKGFASFYVGEDATDFVAYGLGIYAYNRDAAVDIDSAMEVLDPNSAKITNICTVMLNGHPGINHIINDTGDAVKTAGSRKIITKFPKE